MGSVGDHHCDVLILGGGIFGTSTAYHLSLTHPDPSRIIVLDRAHVPSPDAASSDINKIVRADYSKAFYMDLASEAMESWTKDPLLRSYFHQTGWVMVDEKDSDLADRIRKNFRESGRPDTSADVTLDDVKSKWGGVLSGIDTSGYSKAYTNSSAGWADASSAVEAMMNKAIGAGVRHEVGEVDHLVSDGQKLTGVRTADGRIFTAEKILLATGAWTPSLMAPFEKTMKIADEDSIQKQIQAAGVCVAAFKLSEDEARHYSQMPVLIYGAKGEVMPPNYERLFKFTNANTFLNTKPHPITGQDISVPAPDQKSVPRALQHESTEIIRQRVPEILDNGRVPDDWRLCWDAVSPDQNQLITRHPDPRLSNLYFATAGSFHSWKFLPNIGRYVVNVLNGKSNGQEKDKAWAWKRTWSERGAHEKVLPRAQLADFK
ncbi:FAD dependent oxidoreductase [Exophiala viscosa]|uniref:FAD dependent oxidoreductase n=1 Tax=Exophiala viscosa TaxID=2486360 RepID=A0AAN6E670_9EURO|nr:FAD dependent oxidoreductase [Exophiala viscosa]